jgi:hypothetical protein
VGGNGATAKGFRLKVQQMLPGFQEVIPAGSSIQGSPVTSGSISQAAAVSELQAMVSAWKAIDGQVSALKQARQGLAGNLTGWHQQYLALKNALTAFFGPGSLQLEQFGLKPRGAPRKLTAEQIVARTAKTEQTKQLRGTLTKAKEGADSIHR